MNRGKLRKILTGPLIYALLVLLVLGVVQLFGTTTRDEIKKATYTELLQMIEDDQIANVMTQENRLIARTVDSKIPESEFGARYNVIANLASVEQFYNDVNAIYAKKLGVAADEVRATDYKFTVTVKEPESPAWWIEWLPLLVTVLLFIGLWVFMVRQQGGGNKGVMNFGRSRAHVNDPEKNKVTFADVAGAEEETDELREIVDFLKEPKRYLDLGARIPKGVLLVGPPGTGKTLLARAVAGEAGVPFFSISGSDFVEMFVGVGASRVRDLFEQAKKHAPSIVFIDEIDAVGRQRGAGLGGGHDEREQTLNQLLVEMDGFTANEGIIVMAATNRSDILDPALLRPGRFDRQIVVNYPDMQGREEILKIHSRGKPLADDVDLGVLARRTPYCTGADLENIMNEAAILTARAHKDKIEMATIEEAISRVSAGPEKKSHRITDKDKKLVSYHEAGHAIVSYYIPECDKVHEISIIPRGRAAGYTMYLPEDETSHVSSRKLVAMMTSLLGGHCAEELAIGDVSTGSTSDLKRATDIARSMVTEYGMSKKLGPMFLGGDQEVFLGRNFNQTHSNFSEEVSALIDNEMREMLESCYAHAASLLTEHRDKLDRLAEILMDREKVDHDQFVAVMEGEKSAETDQAAQAEPENN
ncbi:MAG: ATP-dependent zinc metalloprotease FtsH [Eubacteriales bacterium]|nr:ATP-dependent zinc metalloprotease FtsH [bacterium]MDY2791323.1 ATP-dependent zinc metalloprotease FtsH [Eubacteriales bacterium]